MSPILAVEHNQREFEDLADACGRDTDVVHADKEHGGR